MGPHDEPALVKKFRIGRWLCGQGYWLVPALLAIGLALPWLFGEMWRSDAAYYQAIAMNASRNGHWWTLMEGDIGYFNKPPLAFWAHALSVLVLGEVDYAYYLPEAIFYVLTCVTVASIARRLLGPRMGLLAGVAMALTNDWVFRIANFRLEYSHTLAMILAVRCFIEAAQMPWPDGRESCKRVWLWTVLTGVAIGASLLIKPFIALGIPALLVVWLLASGMLTRRQVLLACAVGLVGVLVALPWHVSMIAQHGQAFTDAYIQRQTIKRATGAMFDAEPWYWYFQHISDTEQRAIKPHKMLVIYGLAALGILVVALGFRRSRPGTRRAGDMIGVVWTVLWMAALSAFADKRVYYIMVVHPGTALLAGLFVGRVLEWIEDRRTIMDPQDDAVGRLVRFASIVGLVTAVVLIGRGPWLIERGRVQRVQPERAELFDWVRANRYETFYNAGIMYQEAALVFIKTGVWPKTLVEKEPVPSSKIPSGALGIYRQDQVGRTDRPIEIDPNDPVLYRATGERFTYVVFRRR